MPLSRFVKKLVQSRKIDMKEGHISIFGIPGVLVPANTWINLIEKAEDRFGPEVFDVLFEVGRDQGNQSVKDVGSKNKMGQREFVEKMVGLGNIMGLGKFEIQEMTPDQSFKLSVEDSPFLREKDSSRKHNLGMAEFLKGVAYGIGEGIFKGSVNIEPTQLSYSRPNKVVFKVFR